MPTDDTVTVKPKEHSDPSFISKAALVRRRAIAKCKITNLFKRADSDKSDSNLTNSRKLILEILEDVKAVDCEINQLLCTNASGETVSEDLAGELEGQSNYCLDIHNKLSSLVPSPNPAADTDSPRSVSGSCKLRLPDLKCDYFSGEGSTNFQFHTFLSQFKNVVGNRPNLDDATKLTYLKSYVKGYAAKIIQHLQISDVNYKVALNLLTAEFLDEEALIDDLMAKLLKLSPKPDNTFLEMKIFLNEVRCVISDLNLYNKDFMADNCGNLLMSHVVFSKLPVLFRQELVRKLGCKYPTLKQILDNYIEIVRILTMKKPGVSTENMLKTNDRPEFQKPTVSRSVTVDDPPVPGPDYAGPKARFCKLCSATGHSMLHCKRYDNFASRKNRCVTLKLCLKCSSTRHAEQACNAHLSHPCLFCKSRSHISALCSKYVPQVIHNHCLNSSNDSNTNFVLPTLKVKLAVGDRITTVRCLLDSGSQRSYFSSKVLRRLNINNEAQTELMVNTFLNNGSKTFNEIATTIYLPKERDFVIPVLISEDFDLKYCVDGLKTAHDNISKKYKLADRVVKDEVCMDGLLGADVLQCFNSLELVNCMGGKALKLESGLVPIGNVDNFLSPAELEAKYDKRRYEDHSVDQAVVNYVLHPVKSNCDPLDSVLVDSSIDGKLDDIFSLESIGIKDNETEEKFDEVAKFNEDIKLIDGNYHVALPWKNNISRVKPNFEVARAVVRKVVTNLHRDGLYDSYEAVLEQQVKGDILEPINLEDLNVDSHVWIPHRPVVKTDSATTKVRIVLNCSCKTGDAPSLNEAAFPGVNLLNNLLELLIKIRANRYLVMSDIKSAYLMIKLDSDFDRDKFSILWINREGRLVAYRYKSLVFGYICSPFVLHHIIRYHLQSYPADECSDFLTNQMYVDNLFYTGSDPNFLRSTYLEAYNRLADGGFELREWASNNADLSAQFEADGRAMVHPENGIKVLGYRYCAATDKLRVADFDTDVAQSITKREVLSYAARIFDPLGFVFPITIAAKIFINKLWKAKLGWDDPLDTTLIEEWNRIKLSLDKVPCLSFDRCAYEGAENRLVIFCDSSKSAYGFCAYIHSKENRNFNLIFAKSKVAPKKTKSLPTLELLASFIALKCLPSILSALKGKITEVTLCVDAQVVLSWILSKNVKSKNIFARNRVVDISKMREEINDEFGIEVKFRYVPTALNPADLLTRGTSFDELSKQFEFWLHGPDFLRKDIKWPNEQLNCLSESSKLLTMSIVSDVKPDFVPINRFSSLNKLVRVASLVLKFISKLKRRKETDLELTQRARVKLFQLEQSRYFDKEINYLSSSNESLNTPPLVRNLNLYLDDDCLLRSRGRLAQCDHFPEDVRNPIVLPRLSFLTELIISDVHKRCMHMGVATTLACVRKGGFWITKGRAAVRSVLSRCIECKKINAHPFKYPKPNDYVKDKVDFVTPFFHCGIDFTGHFWVKIDDVSRKMYLLVFTCLNVRAVHLELLADMSCRSFLLAFIRFCNVHGMPSAVYSDNAQTFLMSMGIIGESCTNDEFSNYLIENNIRHVRIPLYSAWIGAAWERMIRTIKSALYKVVGRKQMCYFELITIISDIVNVVNSRPLTYRGNDDDLEFITPNSFLKTDTGRSLVFGGVSGTEIAVPNRKQLVAALEKREALLDRFKELWYDDYLLSLRETNRDLFQDEWHDRIKVDDVVLISAPNKPRPSWQMGRVAETLRGKDGKVRCVRVVRPDSSDGVYSISALYPLELSVSPSSSAQEDSYISERPKRAAAVEGLRKIRDSNR